MGAQPDTIIVSAVIVSVITKTMIVFDHLAEHSIGIS